MKKNLFTLLGTVLGCACCLSVLDRAVFHIFNADAQQGLKLTEVLTLAGGQGLMALTLLVLVSFCFGIARFISRHFQGKISFRALIVSVLLPIVGVGFYSVGKALSSGAWISTQSYASLLPWVFTAVCSVCFSVVILIGLWLWKKTRNRQKWRILTNIGYLSISFALLIVNVKLFYNLYPELHILLYLASVLFAGWSLFGFVRLLYQVIPKRFILPITILFKLCLLSTFGMFLMMDRSTRSALIAKSVTTTDMVRETSQVTAINNKSLLYDVLKAMETEAADRDTQVALPRGQITVPDDWNVILMVNDATRADTFFPVRKRKSRYIRKKHTPFLNKWLKKTFRFKHAYSQAANTERSMPPFFKSLQPYEDAKQNGTSLGIFMKSLGRTPIAVVPSYFQEPSGKEYPQLLEGFEETDVYAIDDQKSMVPKALRLFEKQKGRPFFAWIHTYAMHSPYYSEKGIPQKTKKGFKQVYRQTARWLDGQYKQLFSSMEKMGLMKKTVIVFGADHGHNLGDHNSNSHGSTVWDTTVRVPLAFYIPNQKGKVIGKPVVSNIDVIPTIADLLGAPKQVQHRGNSLVPFFTQKKVPWKGEYYLRARRGTIVGLVHNRQKIIHDVQGDVIYRYDLEKDPGEEHNLFDIKNPLDRSLLIRVMRHTPGRFEKQLSDLETKLLFYTKLKSIRPDFDSSNFRFLLKLAALDKTRMSHEIISKIYDNTKETMLKLLIATEMYSNNVAFWKKKLKKEIKLAEKTEAELAIIQWLAAHAQTPFSPKFVGQHMDWWAKNGTPTQWLPWIQLIEKWPRKKGSYFSSALTTMLWRIRQTDKTLTDTQLYPQLLNAILNSVKTSRFNNTGHDGRVEQNILAGLTEPFLHHEKQSVRAAASEALGIVGDQKSSELLRKVLEEAPPMNVRQAALNSVFKIEGKKSLPLIISQGADPIMAMDVIRLVRRHKFIEALPFLKKTAKHHFMKRVRKFAASTVEAIKRETKLKKTSSKAILELQHQAKISLPIQG